MISTRDQNTIRPDLLFQAIQAGNLNLVKALATLDDQNKINSNGRTPIAEAALTGKKEIVGYLLNKIIAPNLTINKELNQNDCFQLNRVVLFAIHRDEFNKKIEYLEKLIRKLFANGADCSCYFSDTLQNALHIAAQKGIAFKNILELLLKHATSEQFNKPDAKNKTPMMYIEEISILKACVKYGFVKNHDILFSAISSNNLKIIKKFAKIDDQNKTHSNGQTPIAEAAHNGQKETVDYLFNTIIVPNLDKNMTLNQNDCFQLGCVVLHAINRNEFNNDIKYLENLLTNLFFYGANNCFYHYRNTLQNALHITAQKGIEFKNIFELLLQRAKWDAINKLDCTNKLPLDYAFDNGNAEFIKMLIGWESKKYLISFFIIFRSNKLPPELLLIIAENLLELDKLAINFLKDRIKALPDYEFIMKASCALDEYKKHSLMQTSLDKPSIAFFQNVEHSLKKNKIKDRVSETKSSMRELFSHANDPCQAAAYLSKFGLMPMTDTKDTNENKESRQLKI